MNQKLRVSRFFRLPVAALSATFIATCAYAQAPAVGTGPIHDRMQAARANPELEKKTLHPGPQSRRCLRQLPR